MSLLVQSSHMRIDVKRYIGVQELALGFIRRGFSFIFPCVYSIQHPSVFLKKNLNASKPSKQSKGLGGNIGCRDKNSTWY